MFALGRVWTAPWQELPDAAAALVGCGHVSGLFVLPMWPLVIMLCAEGPNRLRRIADNPPIIRLVFDHQNALEKWGLSCGVGLPRLRVRELDR